MIYYRSFNLIKDEEEGYNRDTETGQYEYIQRTQIVWIDCDVDTITDLPSKAYRTITTGYERGTIELATGSKGHTIDTNKNYMMASDGTWYEQQPEQSIYFYTKDEIDNMIEDINTDLGSLEDDLDDEVTARQTADAALEDVLTGLINTGGKNRCQTNSGSQTGSWMNIPLVLPAGEYMISFGTLSSTDTDATTCQLGLFNSSWTNLIGSYPQLQRGNNITVRVTISEESATLRVYSSDTSAHGNGDTVTFSDLMVCSIDDWNISNTYVPYCPTLAELYALVKSYHP